MLLKVNPTKQNIQTEQGALVVTGFCYVQLHTPLTYMRRLKVLVEQKGKEEEKQKSNEKHERSLCRETRNKTAWHQSPPKETHRQSHQLLIHSHVHTRIQWLLGRSSDASDGACRRERRETREEQRKTTGSPWQQADPSHQSSSCYNTENNSTRSASPRCALWQCLLIMCKKKTAFFLLRRFTFMDCWFTRCPACLWWWWRCRARVWKECGASESNSAQSWVRRCKLPKDRFLFGQLEPCSCKHLI